MTTGRPYRQQLLGILWPELCLVLWKLGLHFVNEESGALLGADGEGGGDENSQREEVPFQKLRVSSPAGIFHGLGSDGFWVGTKKGLK